MQDFRISSLQRCPVCPYCKADLTPAEHLVGCPTCHTAHHFNCWIENQHHCSVFSCSSIQIVAKESDLRAVAIFRSVLLIHCLLNIGVHFFINSFAPLVHYFRITDALIVIGIESLMICSGIAILGKAYALDKQELASSPLAVLNLIILSSNILFVLSLFLYFLADGAQALFALIWL